MPVNWITLHDIWEKHIDAIKHGLIMPGFIEEVHTHCGYELTDSEVERIAKVAKDADDFDSIWADQDWWLDRFNGMDDC